MADSEGPDVRAVQRQIGDYFDLDFQRGEIRLRGVKGRAFILPTETWITLRKELTKTFREGATPFMLQIGNALGSSFMEQMKRSDSSAEAVLARLPEVASVSGWGSFEIKGDVKFGRDLTFSVRRCPFCIKVENTSAPVCDFLVGVINGLCDNLFARAHEAREVSCLALGNELCDVRVTEASETPSQQRHWGSYLLFPWLFGPKR